jgi:hypothetical protein
VEACPVFGFRQQAGQDALVWTLGEEVAGLADPG